MKKEDVMQVAQYLFQSPSPNPVQVGRLDPSSLKKEQSSSESLPKEALNTTASKAESFAATQVKEVKPTVAENSIDLYV